jgi:hypothetical protein
MAYKAELEAALAKLRDYVDKERLLVYVKR